MTEMKSVRNLDSLHRKSGQTEANGNLPMNYIKCIANIGRTHLLLPFVWIQSLFSEKSQKFQTNLYFSQSTRFSGKKQRKKKLIFFSNTHLLSEKIVWKKCLKNFKQNLAKDGRFLEQLWKLDSFKIKYDLARLL